MASEYFSLGSTFLAWTPESITYGDAHHVAKHDLLGGGRVFDLMGTNPSDIAITGKMTNSTRFQDRDAIKAMIGTRQTLTFGDDSLDVIVMGFPLKQDYACIEYTISCTPLVSSTTPTPTVQSSAATSVAAALAL